MLPRLISTVVVREQETCVVEEKIQESRNQPESIAESITALISSAVSISYDPRIRSISKQCYRPKIDLHLLQVDLSRKIGSAKNLPALLAHKRHDRSYRLFRSSRSLSNKRSTARHNSWKSPGSFSVPGDHQCAPTAIVFAILHTNSVR